MVQKKVIISWAIAILIISALAGLIYVKQPETINQTQAFQNIVIKPDGTVTPADAPVTHFDNVYQLTQHVYGTIRIQKSNIVLNGAGHTLSGPYNGSQANVWAVGEGPNQSPDLVAEYIIGVDLGAKTVEGVTLQNLNVKNFSIGVYLWTKNNTITNCAVSESILGVMLSGSNTTIAYNYLTANQQGLFFGFNGVNETIPSDIIIHHNTFDHNTVQINGCFCEDYPDDEEPHAWDDGRQGNYWSDYNGTDTNGDGIGDSSYVIDAMNLDRYPLMTSSYQRIAEILSPKFDPVAIAIAIALLILVTCLIGSFFKRRRIKSLIH